MKTKNIDNQTRLDREEFAEALIYSSKQVISTYADYPTGLNFPMHHHLACQLLYASKGVMTVETEHGKWIVPESYAVWIPSNMTHKIEAQAHLTLRSIYIRPEAAPLLPKQCTVVSIHPPLSELITYAADFSMDYPDNSHENRVMAVILDLIGKVKKVPFLLPFPKDSRLILIARGLLADPSNKESLTEWADRAGLTGRSISRLFIKDTGLNFEQWRLQVRLMTALQQLASGEKVSSIALDMGYSSVSAFVTMFKKQLGKTPGQYFKS